MKRNRKWSFITAVVLALVMLATAIAPAMAQNEEEATATPRPVIDGLAIIAPLMAPVGEPVTMTVLQRSDATPVGGAGVWAVTREEAAALSERLAAMRLEEISSADMDWETTIEAYGEFLGRTDGRGKLEHAFNENGRYVLLAAKRGYVPGRTGISIGERPKALGIRAPERAPVGEAVVITVFERGSGEPVEGAGVWALSREEAESLREEIEALREAGGASLADTDWESLLDFRGIFLGKTGESGNLEYAFEESGRYLLLAAKRGYLPGRQGIGIGIPEFMAMEVQRWAQTGEVVTMTVFELASGEPVEGAGIWALSREEAESLREEIAALRESADASLADADLESLVSVRGILLGRTDKRGHLDYAFSEPGGRVLVSVKRGYIPAHAFIAIRAPRPQPERPQRMQPAPEEAVPFPQGGGNSENQ